MSDGGQTACNGMIDDGINYVFPIFHRVVMGLVSQLEEGRCRKLVQCLDS